MKLLIYLIMLDWNRSIIHMPLTRKLNKIESFHYPYIYDTLFMYMFSILVAKKKVM